MNKKVILFTTTFGFIIVVLFCKNFIIEKTKTLLQIPNHNNVDTAQAAQCTYSLDHFSFHYKLDCNPPSIVMLGNSMMSRGDWQHLLHRDDIANRGIAGDFLPCIYQRTKFLQHLNAKIWFIEGGINDLDNQTPNQLLEEYKKIVNFVQNEKSIPVITLLFYVRQTNEDSTAEASEVLKVNGKITELNLLLRQYAINNHLECIDINASIAEAQTLKPEYTTDGVHLSESAYAIWANAIEKILLKYNI